jgi:bacterioferritin-associated ferredoxin
MYLCLCSLCKDKEIARYKPKEQGTPLIKLFRFSRFEFQMCHI